MTEPTSIEYARIRKTILETGWWETEWCETPTSFRKWVQEYILPHHDFAICEIARMDTKTTPIYRILQVTEKPYHD